MQIFINFPNFLHFKDKIWGIFSRKITHTREVENSPSERNIYPCEVIYAEGLHIQVTVDGQSGHKRVNDRKMPVAFSYTKFEIYTTGVLNVENADDSYSLQDRTATFHWIKLWFLKLEQYSWQ